MMRFKQVLVVAMLLGFTLGVHPQSSGVKKRRPLPHDFGAVVMNNLSQENGLAPVVFSHWLHRSKYTCRLCHVDIGFAMQANATRVRSDDLADGYYCAACHDGRTAFGGAFRKGSNVDEKSCDRCHSYGKDVPQAWEFSTFTADFPRGRFGNNIDWEKAEDSGKIKLTDTLPGISIKRRPLDVPKDYNIEAKMAGLPEIIFSHKKHAVWNGCELCHPDIYGVKAGTTKYTMEDVFAGKFCGACHGSVAFPAMDCQRCHTRPVSGS